MIWLAFPAFVFLTARLVIVIVNMITRQWLRKEVPENAPSVSVLIPARNEAENLPQLLDGLMKQTYEPFDIWIFDDDSRDGTRAVIASYAARYSRIRYLEGQGVPEGWNGKNNACHQLAMKAEGEYLLFLDADVRVEPDLLAKAVQHARRRNLTLLSIFPRQLMLSFGEKITVPVMNWILVSLLPLALTRWSHYTSLSAANGQFMLFRGREYRQHRFHAMVKEINVEDIHIFRLVKRMGYSAHTVLSRGEISCRMYRSLKEGVIGFTRSVFAFFGGSGTILLLFTLFTTFGVFFVWAGMGLVYALVYLTLALLLRALVAMLSVQPILAGTLLSPLIQLSFVRIVIRAFLFRARGKNVWKGRTIKFTGI
ncbi:MAG TPA: glycosyltransferase [Bacteroides sp.]|nr:glycosyltransferase [Bacteroides sp.]